MSSEFDARELCRLASQALDGDEIELARLEALLSTSPEARQFYYLTVSLHSQLAWQFGESQPAAPAVETNPQGVVEGGYLASGGALIFWQRGVSYLSRPAHFGVFFASVATVALLLFFAQIRLTQEANPRLASDDSPQPLAWLTASENAQWGDPERLPVLHAGIQAGETLELVSGLAEVRFRSTKVFLQGPVRFRIDSATGGTLERGTLTARVTSQGRGFSITTPHVKVVDLGTEFGVQVDALGVTEVHVFSGQVETVLINSRAADSKRQSLVARQALRFDPRQPAPPEYVTADASKFVSLLPPRVRRNELPITPEYVAAVLRSEPLAYWRFEQLEGDKIRDEIGQCELTVQGLLELRGTDANRVAHFRPGVALASEQPLIGLKNQPYALEFWCQPTSPAQSSPGSLVSLMTEGTPGKWGHLSYLMIQRADDAPDSSSLLRGLHRWPAGIVGGTDVYHRELSGGWQHVALVKTAAQLKLYVQGVEVATAEDQSLPTSDSFRVLVGSLDQLTDSRYFSGTLDELAIYARALSAQEIAERVSLIEPLQSVPGDK